MKARLFLFFVLGLTAGIPAQAQYWGPVMCPQCNAIYAYGPQIYGAYGYAPGYILGPGPGIKFNLSRIPPDQRKTIESGRVYLRDRNGHYSILGFVGEFSGAWNRAVPLANGQYDIAVELPDERVAEFSVVAGMGRTNVLLTPDMFQAPQPPPNRNR